MRKLILVSASLMLTLQIFAQTNILVKGRIMDAGLKQAVPYATVLLNRKPIYADENGLFKAEIARAESYFLEIDQIGYEPLRMNIGAIPASELEFSLQPRPVWISEILVTGQQRPAIAQSGLVHDAVKLVSQPRDIGDLLNDVPGFAMIKRGGYALDPVFRSFKYEQLNVVYDGGVELTHACPNRMDPTTTHINPEEIKKIELIRGPFSVRYGPSMGATINIVTETPFQTGGPTFGGSLEGGYEFNGDGKTTRLSLFNQKNNYHIQANAGLKEYGNYVNGAGKEIPTAFKNYDYGLKAGLNLSQHQQVQASWRQAFSRDVLHAGLMMDTDYDNTSIATADYLWRRPGSTLHQLTAKVYGSYVDHQMSNKLRPNYATTASVSNVTATTFGSRIEANLLAGVRQWWFAGADFRHTGREGSRERVQKRNMMTGEPLPKPMVFYDTIWPEAAISSTGLFLEGRRILNDRWTLLTGLRTDLVRATAKETEADFEKLYGADANDKTEFNVSATASLAYQMSERLTLQLAAGRGVRTANMIERYINHFNVGRDPYEYVGNPNLKPEANQQLELSLQSQGEIVQWSIQAYYSYLTNYITAAVDSSLKRKFMPTTPPKVARRFVNIDAAQQAGFEAMASVQMLKRLKLSGSLAYTYAENLDWNEPLPEVAPLEATLGLNYQHEKWWVEARGRLVAAQNRVSNIFGEPVTPGFQTVDLRAGIELFRHLNLGFAVINLFDENYWEHLNRAYTNMPEQGVLYETGRNISLYVKFSF